MHCGILVQARMSSSRLPGKMLMPIQGIPLALWVLRRCALSRVAERVALVTSCHASDDALAEAAAQAGFPCFRGPLDDVRLRYIQAAHALSMDVVGRVCGDSPFVDVDMLDTLLQHALTKKAVYLRVVDTLPGFVSEAFSLPALVSSQSVDPVAVEHVTTALRCAPGRYPAKLLSGIPAPADLPPLTIDTADDLAVVQDLAARGCGYATPARDVLACLTACTAAFR